jgi:hypothetical protein
MWGNSGADAYLLRAFCGCVLLAMLGLPEAFIDQTVAAWAVRIAF